MTPKLNTILALLLLLINLGRVAQTDADDSQALGNLWVDLSMGAPLVDLFNEHANANDIARVEHISQLDLLSGVTTGKKLVVFKSAADAIRLLPHIHEEIDIVGYNLEHGPANPIVEQEHPLESIQGLREVTNEYNLELALGPDRRFAESDGIAMAPYADYFILQVQKVQTEPETVYEFVEPLIAGIREANPDVEISLQIRTEGDVDELLDLLSPLTDDIQGISILTSEDTLLVAEEIVNVLRPIVREADPPTKSELPEEDGSTTPEASSVAAENDAAMDDAAVGTTTTAESVTTQEGVKAGGENSSEESKEDIPIPTPTEVLTVAEENERNGSTALFVAVALVAGFALGAGYVSHRTNS